MINAKRIDGSVSIEVTVCVPGIGDRIFKATFQAGCEDYAAFLANAIKEQMNNRLMSIRRYAYNQGWKDAKAKCRKETWFSGQW